MQRLHGPVDEQAKLGGWNTEVVDKEGWVEIKSPVCLVPGSSYPGRLHSFAHSWACCSVVLKVKGHLVLGTFSTKQQGVEMFCFVAEHSRQGRTAPPCEIFIPVI